MTSRREFLTSSAALGIASSAYAAGSDIIKVGLIGCGGRGTEAAGQALTADKGVRLVALGDLLLDRAQERRSALKVKFPEQVTATNDTCFSGFDNYKKVIEASDVVLIANAAKFHPLHMKAAVDAGKHVFVEKPHAIDPAGLKMVRAACDAAKQKNVSVLSGLQSRYTISYREIMQRIHDGAIGDIVTIEENFLRAPYVLYPRKPGLTEVQWQGSNQYHFHWLSGDDVPQSLVHNLDRSSWAMKGQAPVKCRGMGGRSTLRGEIYGSTFDHHSIVYEFANGTKIFASCRTIPNCYNETSSIIYGTKGRADVMRGIIDGENKWAFSGPKMYASAATNPYQIEHNELFKAIRSGKPINSGDYMVRSTQMGVMGQISCYTGQQVTYDQVSASDFFFAPRPEDVREDMEAPVLPDKDGIYPVYIPGVTKLL